MNGLKQFLGSITFKVIAGLIIFDTILLLSITTLMNTVGTKLVVEESSKRVEETGNNMVMAIGKRLKNIEGLAKSIANAGEKVSFSEKALRSVLINIINFDDDYSVAGGGVWFEPKAFDNKTIRKSFFWGRDDKNKLQFFDDYNKKGLNYDEDKFNKDEKYKNAFLAAPGYQNEEWYVVVRHMKGEGQCFWSSSYMDPYSFQPMVTVTCPMKNDAGSFIGVSTVDLKLEGLNSFTEEWREKTGGYIFILDRNGKFVSFPKPELAKNITKDDKGKIKSEEFITIDEFAKKYEWFNPITKDLRKWDDEILKIAEKNKNYDSNLAAEIDKSSYQISEFDARAINAIIHNPLGALTKKSNLVESFDFSNDQILKEKAKVSFFHLPESYWKVVVVKPYSEYISVAQNIKNTLLKSIFFIVLALFSIASFYQIFFVARPLKSMTNILLGINQDIKSGKELHKVEKIDVNETSTGEISKLGQVFNELLSDLIKSDAKLRIRLERILSATDEMGKAKHALGAVEIAKEVILEQLNIETPETFIYIQENETIKLYKMDHQFEINENGCHLPFKSLSLSEFEENFGALKNLSLTKKNSSLLVPISTTDENIGLIDIPNFKEAKLMEDEEYFVKALISSLGISLVNINYVNNLEHLVESKTLQLVAAQKLAIGNAHKAGMAEMAVGVLHNIGNHITHLSVISEWFLKHFNHSPIKSTFPKISQLIKEKGEGLGDYLTNDPKGKTFPEFLLKIFSQVETEQDKLIQESKVLIEGFQHVGEIIKAQKDFASVKETTEKINLLREVKSCLDILKPKLSKDNVSLQINIPENVEISTQKSKFQQVIVNLVKNSSEAFDGNTNSKLIDLSIENSNNGTIDLKIKDNGPGIPREIREKIFNFGYTTKKDGHGFGLHSSFNQMKEMGGELSLSEDQNNEGGATFILKFKKAA